MIRLTLGSRIRAIVTAISMALLVAVPCRAGGPETTTTIDIPGALVTVASGINPEGTIVGWYCLQLPCNPAHSHGFMLKGTTLTKIDVPGDRPSLGTQPRYISPQGVVIGDYAGQLFKDSNNNTVPQFRGFAWYNNTFTYFDAPSSLYDNAGEDWPLSIIPRAINTRGQVVGCIHDRDQADSMHGFLLSDGTFSRLTPGMTMNNGITSTGDIVGLDGSGTTAYHIDRFGNEERVSCPWADATDAWDINLHGEIVGTAWTNGGKVPHAFLRTADGTFRLIDPPGAISAIAFGIAANGDVVGQYSDGSGSACANKACVHGFLLRRGE